MNISDMEDANRNRLLDIVQRIPAGTPDGWEKTTYAVGGLMYVGFSNVRTEKLVVISSQSQSVIDCKTGSKTYCTENYDEGDLIALAEELGDEIVPIAGEGGGGLRRYSNDGNTLISVAPFWPAEKIVFMPNYTLYTFGFSKCGNYMAVCNSHTLDIFKKICS